MKVRSPFRRFSAGIFLVGLLLCFGGSVVNAGQIFSESFEFGQGVAGREHLEAGDAFASRAAVQEGEGEWHVGIRGQRGLKVLEYVQGGGIRFVHAEAVGVAGTSLFVRLPAGIDAQTWEATVEFIPGTLWAEGDSGFNGLWLGLLEESNPQRLLANIEDTELVVARVWFSGGRDSRAMLVLRAAPGDDELHARGRPLNIDPEALHRLVFRVDRATRVAEVVLQDEQGNMLAELSRPDVRGAEFNSLKIDLLSLTSNETGVPLVLKKALLKAE